MTCIYSLQREVERLYVNVIEIYDHQSLSLAKDLKRFNADSMTSIRLKVDMDNPLSNMNCKLDVASSKEIGEECRKFFHWNSKMIAWSLSLNSFHGLKAFEGKSMKGTCSIFCNEPPSNVTSLFTSQCSAKWEAEERKACDVDKWFFSSTYFGLGMRDKRKGGRNKRGRRIRSSIWRNKARS